MKIGFINGGLNVSETFIHSLIKDITLKYPETIFYTSQTPYYQEGICTTQISFIYKPNSVEKRAFHILGHKGKALSIKQQQKYCTKKLENIIKDRDILYIDYGTTAVDLLPLLQKSKKPFIVHFHGFDVTSALSIPYYKEQIKIIFSKAKYLIAASNHIRRLLILAGATNNKIKVIHLGIEPIKLDIDIWKQRIASPLQRIVFIGRLTPKKHPIALIRAFELVYYANNKTHLDIIGDGPLLNECKDLVAKLKLDMAVTFHGSLPNDKAVAHLEHAWLYAQHSVTAPSGDQEGFAISLAEAALYELPVVSTLHNGIPENVIDGKTGFLVKEFDFEDMANKMLILLNDPVLAEKMGKRGKEHIKQLCDPALRIKKVIKLIEDAH